MYACRYVKYLVPNALVDDSTFDDITYLSECLLLTFSEFWYH